MKTCKFRALHSRAVKTQVVFIQYFILLMLFAALTAVYGETDYEVPEAPIAGEENISIPPPSPSLSEEKIPEWTARWELARVLSYLDRLEESIEQYEKLLALRPELVEAKLEMLRILVRHGEGELVIDKMREIDPEELNPDAMLLLAEVYVQMEEYEAAENIYLNHLATEPDAVEVRLRLAEILSWVEKYEESLAQYEILLDYRPDDINLRRKYAFVLIWAGYREKGAEELRKTLE